MSTITGQHRLSHLITDPDGHFISALICIWILECYKQTKCVSNASYALVCMTGKIRPNNSLLLTYEKWELFLQEQRKSQRAKKCSTERKAGWWSSGDDDDDELGQLATLCSRTASLNVREKGMMCCRRSLSPLRSAMVLCMRALISCEPARTCSAWARWLGSRFMEWRVRAANVYRGKAHAASMSVWERGCFSCYISVYPPFFYLNIYVCVFVCSETLNANEMIYHSSLYLE